MALAELPATLGGNFDVVFCIARNDDGAAQFARHAFAQTYDLADILGIKTADVTDLVVPVVNRLGMTPPSLPGNTANEE